MAKKVSTVVLDDASETNPVDVTSKIVNPSFESSFAGWINEGFSTQSNNDFNPQKQGNTYAERWVGIAPLPNVTLSQRIKGLPYGKYTLKVGAQHITENPLSGQPGAYVFANTIQKEVTVKNEYTIDFLVMDSTTVIGFKTDNSKGNWAACDNFRLYYKGVATEAMKEKLQALIDSTPAVLAKKMQNATRTALENALASAKQSISQNAGGDELTERVKQLETSLTAAWVSNDAYTQLQTAIDAGTAAYGDGSGKEAATLLAVINQKKTLVANLDAALADLQKAPDEINAAILAYRYTNASNATPLDLTQRMANPSFESGFTGWNNTGLYTQNNADFNPQKAGNTYAERWASSPPVPNVSVSQQVKDLPNGKYTLTIGAQNISQNPDTGQPGGFVFGNNAQAEVKAKGEYSVDFLVVDGTAVVGFKTENSKGNWMACDNFRLYYKGAATDALKERLQSLVDSATIVLGKKMRSTNRTALEAALAAAKATLDQNGTEVAERIAQLETNLKPARISVDAYGKLQIAVDSVLGVYGNGTGNGAAAFKAAIDQSTTLVNNLDAELSNVQNAPQELYEAMLMFRVANATGSAPVVVTDPRFARGATMAFGRSTVSGVAQKDIIEQGFCWSTSTDPKISDNRTTKFFSNNGAIYRLENLQPATVYYMRAYAIGPNFAVGYGKVLKVITIPKGTVTYELRESVINGGDNYPRIRQAVESGVYYYNNLTSVKDHHLSVNYHAGTPTAEASYGGYMQFGANPSYQRTGTALHEMNHTIGVGQHWIWYGPNSPLRAEGSRGRWLGERANKLVQFLENNTDGSMTGDAVHMWPFGINGAHEDTGNEFLYTAHALVTQALGEDGLANPSRGFTTPAYTFEHTPSQKYYLKVEGNKVGLNTSFLAESESGQLVNKKASGSSILTDDRAAWYLEFDPATAYYQLRNTATGKLFTYQESTGIGLKTSASLTAAESFQFMGARYDTKVGTDEKSFRAKAYWIISPKNNYTSPTLAASSPESITTVPFDLTDAATAQRWLIFTQEQVKSFDSLLVAPTAVKNMYVASGDNKITITWNPAFSTVYEVLRSESENGTYTSLAKDLSSGRYEDPTASNGKQYYYKMVAYNELGTSPASASLAGKPVKGQHLHLAFDETSGTTAHDDWGGYHAQLTNGAAWTAGMNAPTDVATLSDMATTANAAQTDGAVALSQAAASYLELPPGVVSTLSDFTLATWVRIPQNISDNTRIFDFGTGTGAYMALSPKAGQSLYYEITHAGINYRATIPYTLPRDQWIHVAISQKDTTFKFFVNGQVIFTDNKATVKPSDLGVTTLNYLGRSMWANDPYADLTYGDFRIYNYALADNNVATLANASALPVQLVSFEGKASHEGNHLIWKTAQELNNDHFVLERALYTPTHFKAITQIKGNGTTRLPSTYQFLDPQAKGRLAYYRLVQVDTDGKTSESRIISVDNRTLRPLVGFPNPVSAQLTIELPDREISSVQIHVLNTTGHVVYESKNHHLDNGNLQLDMSGLTIGVYRVIITHPIENYGLTIIKK
ncbi:LamG-like jellyroll fold domain-containing protein [Siphonobacter curvatus]|uniref:LamG-like jellyroll fold domain-containing protein n=1 Tax=Siphonobacter curvatus TaxID=2094562 RepID=UPI0013FDC40B|nr:LamG-like jellyroll fold domain-containing protein [Siphonobacter curvatus]